jgi:hypothetical protein
MCAEPVEGKDQGHLGPLLQHVDHRLLAAQQHYEQLQEIVDRKRLVRFRGLGFRV